MKDIFPERDLKYNLRKDAGFKIKNVSTVRCGTDTISYLGPKIWNLLPGYMKEIQNLETFKKEIKPWVPQNCPCKLCKLYVPGIGYLNIT